MTTPQGAAVEQVSPAPTACRARNLSVAYRSDPVLRNVDFEVPQGVVMGIVGPNGAGKSTLIKAMLGLVKPLAGTSEFFGHPLTKMRRRVGYMPQSTSVDWDFPTTVLDVVTMGTFGSLGWLRRPGKAERTRAEAALEETGVSEPPPGPSENSREDSANESSSRAPWHRRPSSISWTSPSKASTRRVSARSSMFSTLCAHGARPW